MEFGIKIETNGKTLRLGTDRLEILENVGGQETEAEYLPYIQSIDPQEYSIEIDGGPSVPSVKVSVWDAFGDINKELKTENYESIGVTVYRVDSDAEPVSEFFGYMTDVDSKSGITSFSVRINEDEGFNSFMQIFTHKTFQRVQTLVPKNVELYGSWDISEETPWEIIEVQNAKTRVRSVVNVGATSIPLVNKLNLFKVFYFSGSEIVSTGIPLFELTPASRGFYNELFNVGDYPIEQYDEHNLAIVSDVLIPTDEADPTFFLGHHQIIGYKTVTFDSANRTILGGIPATGPFSVKTKIPKYACIAPINVSTFTSGALVDRKVRADRIFVRSNGLVPPSTSAPRSGYGFVDLGLDATFKSLVPVQTGTDASFEQLEDDVATIRMEPIRELRTWKSKLFHRFDISAIFTDGDPNNPILVLDMHNRPLDKTDPYRLSYGAGPASVLGSYEMPIALKKGQKVKLVDLKWKAGQIDFHIGNVEEEDIDILFNDFYTNENAHFLNRLRGSRIDMIDNYSNMVREYSINTDTQDINYSDINNNIVNNATGKFAVGIDSKVTLDNREFTETVYFSLPPHVEDILPIATNITAVNVIDFEYKSRIGVESRFSNYLEYASNEEEKPFFNGASLITYPDKGSDAGILEARNYFLSRLYRVIGDPVPENATDLGQYFPIVYGYVDRVPMIHAISKKAMEAEEKNSAGDDVYIFCSHACGVKNPFDIKIEMLNEQGKELNLQDESKDFLPSVRNAIIENPFPNVLKDHWESRIKWEQWTDDQGVVRPYSYFLKFIGDIYHPYHYTSEFNTVDGKKLFGVKLRGDEWNEQAGVLDRRYPIRNGVGNTKLYASFSGWQDINGEITGVTGSTVEHHLDIVAHYVRTYRNQDPSQESVDRNSWQATKAKCPKLYGCLFINEGPLSVSDLLEKVNKQFGTMWYTVGSKLYFVRPDLDIVDYNKPISDGINLLEGITEDSIGYKKAYHEIVYNYNKDWATGNFRDKVVLDRDNNYYCAQAARSKMGKEQLVIEADMVNNHGVAIEAANYIAKMKASRTVVYKLSVKYVDGIKFTPGDYVPLTSAVFNLNEFPVLVTSVKEERDVISLELLGFLNLL